VRLAGEQIQSLKRNTRGLGHVDLTTQTFVSSLSSESVAVTSAKHDQVSCCGIANVRVLKLYIVLYIKTPRTIPYDIFYDGHNLAACLAERHHCRVECAYFYLIVRDRGQAWRSSEEIDRNRLITFMQIYEIELI